MRIHCCVKQNINHGWRLLLLSCIFQILSRSHLIIVLKLRILTSYTQNMHLHVFFGLKLLALDLVRAVRGRPLPSWRATNETCGIHLTDKFFHTFKGHQFNLPHSMSEKRTVLSRGTKKAEGTCVPKFLKVSRMNKVRIFSHRIILTQILAVFFCKNSGLTGHLDLHRILLKNYLCLEVLTCSYRWSAVYGDRAGYARLVLGGDPVTLVSKHACSRLVRRNQYIVRVSSWIWPSVAACRPRSPGQLLSHCLDVVGDWVGRWAKDDRCPPASGRD